ncbi:beta-ketoacyl-[acyl-carrier-protein] synthase family protein [Aliikangiella maris]|uniref:Beta-ketoacyl-[acyl-carrier-protein] synthase family protein n=2 Tax=Aliikangiella maris TaxID=3162458 RepID=A0ABV2BU13_9GAMM
MFDANCEVVISGLGVNASIGNNINEFWQNLLAGETGLKHQAMLEEKQTPFKFGGYMGTLSPASELMREIFSQQDRAVQLALNAAAQAVEDSCLADIDPAKHTVAVVMGTTCGTNDSIEQNAFDEDWFNCDDFDVHKMQLHQNAFAQYGHEKIAHSISQAFNFNGPSYVVGTACASGNHAIGEAVNLIRSGQADIVLCGGADAFTLLPTFGFYAMKSLASEKCTPFQKDREGMLLGEGAGILVLESRQSAIARGLKPEVGVTAWALNCDAKNFAAPIASGERCEELINLCLNEASLSPAEVDYINVHGTGTELNDLMEARGIHGAFGNEVARIKVSSIKGATGHTLGAAGALDGVASVLSIRNNCVPPNAPITTTDENIGLDIPCEPLHIPVNRALSISFAFGGCNVATLFSRLEN